MSQRLIEGRQRRILGIASNGQPIYQIGGADSAPIANENEGVSGANGEGPSGEGSSDPNQNPAGEQPPEGTPNVKIYTEDEVAALTRRMQAADKNSATIQQELQRYKDKDKTETELLQGKLKEQESRAEQAERQLLEVRLHNKFLASNKYTWHDPETALRLLDTADVTVEEGGKVVGLEEAMAKLAKAKPFLLKQEEKGNSNGGGGRPSGSQPPSNGKGGGSSDAQKRTELEKKYPALRR
jgi:hypothetical protein